MQMLFSCYSCRLKGLAPLSMLIVSFYFQEFDLRRIARSEGRRYCDPVVLTYQAERMPEQIRLKVNANSCLMVRGQGRIHEGLS